MTWRWSGTAGMDLHEALRAACKMLTPVTSYLEIGVDGGGSLNTVLCAGVPKRIVLCDIWDPNYCQHGNSKARVKEIIKFFQAGTGVTYMDGDSKETVPRLAGEVFDLVLVDADHSAAGARADLDNAWPLVRKGGILVMDDIHHPNYPWLNDTWWSWIRDNHVKLIPEDYGGCNADMVMKP